MREANGDGVRPELPDGWEWKRLGEVCEVRSGYGFPKDLQGRSTGDLPFAKVRDISTSWATGDRYLRSATHYVSSEEAAGLRASPLPAGSVIMAKIGEAVRLNRRAILAQDALVDNNVMAWVADTDTVLPEYLFYASLPVRLADISQATTLPSVRKTDVVQLLIAVPPLDEQLQIIETLSGIERRLDVGEGLLADASETKRALVRSFYRDLGLGLEYLPEGWHRKRLSEIAECKLGKMLDAQKNEGTARPYLRNISVQWGHFEVSDTKEMRIKDSEIERFEVRRGDLMMCEGGEPGRCAIWDRDEQIFFQKALHRIRPTEVVLATYLQRYFAFAAQAGTLERHFTGTTIKHLPGTKLASIEIPLPPVGDQAEIVRRATEFDEKLAPVAEAVAAARRQRERLISATLREALLGRLGCVGAASRSAGGNSVQVA